MREYEYSIIWKYIFAQFKITKNFIEAIGNDFEKRGVGNGI